MSEKHYREQAVSELFYEKYEQTSDPLLKRRQKTPIEAEGIMLQFYPYLNTSKLLE